MKFFITLALFVVVAVSALPHKKIRPLMPRLGADSSRIIGGSPAELGQFPYQAAVWSTKSSDTYFCSGSLISADWVLTLALCSSNAIRFTIELGIIDLETPNVQVSASRTFLHPDYVEYHMSHDIALIQLDASVHFNANIAPVAVNGAHIGAGQNAIVSGWGDTRGSDTDLSQFLNWAPLTTIDNAECNSSFVDIIEDGMICANSVDPIKDVCTYDWGGPLVLGEGSSALLIGVIGFGVSCSQNFPSIFTRSSFYRDWIWEVSGI